MIKLLVLPNLEWFLSHSCFLGTKLSQQNEFLSQRYFFIAGRANMKCIVPVSKREKWDTELICMQMESKLKIPNCFVFM